jgi:phosphohistidine phosphatase
MRVYVVRHGAAIDGEASGGPDEERWLTAEGRRKFARVAKRLAKVAPRLTAIYTSPLVRAVQTADLLAGELKFEGPVEVWPVLKPEYPVRSVVQRLGALENGARVALVGHEPQMSAICAALLGRRGFPLPFPKGGVALLEVRGERGRFVWMLLPKGRRFVGLEGEPVEPR